MTNRKRIPVSSIFIMAGAMFCTAALAITTLYRTAIEEERSHLVEFARGEARSMEALVRSHATHCQDRHHHGAREATLSHIAAARENCPRFGETGELVVAHREGDQIVFIFPSRHGTGGDPDPVPWASGLAGPMRPALSGEQGTFKYECENRLRTPSGKYRWNLDRGRIAARDGAGKPLSIVVTDMDITSAPSLGRCGYWNMSETSC